MLPHSKKSTPKQPSSFAFALIWSPVAPMSHASSSNRRGYASSLKEKKSPPPLVVPQYSPSSPISPGISELSLCIAYGYLPTVQYWLCTFVTGTAVCRETSQVGSWPRCSCLSSLTVAIVSSWPVEVVVTLFSTGSAHSAVDACRP
jgi:hypothetical protein